MFKTRSRKILRDVRARLGRTLLVSTAIFIGVTGTIALFTVSNAIIRQLREDIQVEEIPMITIFTATSSDEELDNEGYIQTLSELDGVTDVLGFTSIFGQLKTTEEAERFQDVVLIGFISPYDELPLTPIRLLEGQYPNPEADEIAIETRMAEKYGLSVGSTAYFQILSPSRQPENAGVIATTEAWKVTGIVFDPYVGLRNSGPDDAVYTSIDNANYIAAQRGIGGISARFEKYDPDSDQSKTFADTVARETPYLVAFIQSENPEQSQILISAQLFTNTLAFLALISLLVSGFLVVNVISSIVVEQKRQIGVMKSIGASTKDTFLMYSGIALMYGVIALIFAVPLGIILGDFISHILGDQLDVILTGFQFSLGAVLLGVIVGLMIPIVAAFFPVLLGTRVKILDAITDLGIDAKYGSGPIARTIAILPIPVTMRQGLSNVSLKKGRLFFTMITLSIAVGTAMGLGAVFFNIQTGINIFLDSFNVEILIAPNQDVPQERIEQILRDNFQTEENNLISNFSAGVNLQVNFVGYEPSASAGGPPGIFAYGYDVNSEVLPFQFTITEGETLNAENADTGVIFSSNLANNMEKKVGDQVTLELPGSQVDLTIVGISDFPIDQIWMSWETIALAVGYTTTASLESPLPVPAEAANFIPYATLLALNGETVSTLGFSQDAGNFLGTFVSDGELYSPNSQTLVISAALAESQSLAVGDTLTLASQAEGGQSTEYTVAGILSLPPQMVGEDLPSEFAALFWRELALLDGNTLEEKARTVGIFINSTYEDASIQQTDDLLDEINEVMIKEGISIQSFNFVELVQQINAAFVSVLLIIQLVALLIASVGALGLFTSLSMAVFERQKEIGVMRSIGAGSGTVFSQFLTEGLVVGFLAWLVGLPIGYLIMTTLYNLTGLDETFAADYPPVVMVAGLLGMIIITFFASLWPSFSASRKTVSDILRYQ